MLKHLPPLAKTPEERAARARRQGAGRRGPGVRPGAPAGDCTEVCPRGCRWRTSRPWPGRPAPQLPGPVPRARGTAGLTRPRGARASRTRASPAPARSGAPGPAPAQARCGAPPAQESRSTAAARRHPWAQARGTSSSGTTA
ncbi:hypothetical protein QJS66_16865 [Kocuria rhizophila]|nr:hypothetical protein QJS66_16865 [Kocuria rhizophila]